MAKLSLADFGFVALESAYSPKHVGGLQVYELPEGAKPDFVRHLYDAFRAQPPSAPFDLKLKRGGIPEWVQDDAIDMSYHVRHTALPYPGTRVELANLVEDLHEELLDRSRPMWRFYLIEGVAKGRFATYFKVHHAYMDGVTLQARASGVLSESPDDMAVVPFWSDIPKRPRRTNKGKAAWRQRWTRRVGEGSATVAQLSQLALRHVSQSLKLSDGDLPVPFSSPKTSLNARLTPARSVAPADIPLSVVKEVANAHGVKVNDVILAICDCALREHLTAQGESADTPLVAEVPISLRRGEGEGGGNQIAIALIEMGTADASPAERLAQIAANAKRAKEWFGQRSAAVGTAYTLLLQSGAHIGDVLGLTGRTAPLGNVMISNVPGLGRQRYLCGAPMLSVYPLSTIAPGTALNITILTYEGTMHFGLVAGRGAIPDLHPIATNIERALDDLRA